MTPALAVVCAIERPEVGRLLWADLVREARTCLVEVVWIQVGRAQPLPWAGLPLPAELTLSTYVESPRLGSPEGYSRGAEATAAPWVLLLSDDMRIGEGSLLTGLAWMQAHPEIGLGLGYMDERGSPCQAFEDVGQVPFYTRAMGEAVGWLRCDGAYRHYCPDAELPYRVLERGGLVARIPNACFSHLYVEDEARASRRQPLDDDYRTFLERWPPAKRAAYRAQLETGLNVGGPTFCARHKSAPPILEEEIDVTEAMSRRALLMALHETDQISGGCNNDCEICVEIRERAS